MFTSKRDFLKKTIAAILCVSFTSLFSPGIINAETKSNPTNLLDKSFSLLSPVLSLVNPILPLFVNIHSTKDKNPSDEKKKNPKKKPFDDGGNSVSKKKPNAKD